MNLFILPASNSDSQKHLNQTIRQTFDYKKYLVNLPKNLQEKLQEVESSGGKINLWGTNVERISAWRSMQADDTVIFFSSNEFIYYGTIIAIHQDSEISKNVWKIHHDNKKTYEYLILLKDLKKIVISRKDFNRKFGLSINYTHQRLIRVFEGKDILKKEKFKDFTELIDFLDTSFVIEDDNVKYSQYQDEVNSNDYFVEVSKEIQGGRSRKNKLDKKGTTWARDSKIATNALHQAEYKCELDPSHKSFPYTESNRQYMEAHHLIPMKAQSEHDCDLDTQSNIVSLCPNCHRAIHHANKEFRHDLVKKLYNRRKEKLKHVGINCQIDQLLTYY
ncbi:HNH endonuclease [uncultured Exiguobacterium sp.]|uniref:HNH endonuclease n=1 Tax=uncultured Exiguobacterium sp. TaxID=202669 RepID=UPI0025F9B188|nr:HNH endonuclease [uncultured Exiguobacterium sp.]